jgi:hypothetical protein
MLSPSVRDMVRLGAPHIQHPVRFAGVCLPAVAAVRAVQFYVRNPHG